MRFQVTGPFSKLKDALARVDGVSHAPGSLRDVSYSLSAQVSPELQASDACPAPTLISEARSQAQKIAAAAGLSVGPVLSIADGKGGTTSGAVYAFLSVGGSFLTPSPTATCSLNVQFKLVR